MFASLERNYSRRPALPVLSSTSTLSNANAGTEDSSAEALRQVQRRNQLPRYSSSTSYRPLCLKRVSAPMDLPVSASPKLPIARVPVSAEMAYSSSPSIAKTENCLTLKRADASSGTVSLYAELIPALKRRLNLLHVHPCHMFAPKITLAWWQPLAAEARTSVALEST